MCIKPLLLLRAHALHTSRAGVVVPTHIEVVHQEDALVDVADDRLQLETSDTLEVAIEVDMGQVALVKVVARRDGVRLVHVRRSSVSLGQGIVLVALGDNCTSIRRVVTELITAEVAAIDVEPVGIDTTARTGTDLTCTKSTGVRAANVCGHGWHVDRKVRCGRGLPRFLAVIDIAVAVRKEHVVVRVENRREAQSAAIRRIEVWLVIPRQSEVASFAICAACRGTGACTAAGKCDGREGRAGHDVGCLGGLGWSGSSVDCRDGLI